MGIIKIKRVVWLKKYVEPYNITIFVLSLFGLYHVRYNIPGRKLLKVLTYILSVLQICFSFVGVCMFGAGLIKASVEIKPLENEQILRIFMITCMARNFLVVCIFFYIFEKKSGRGFHEFIEEWRRFQHVGNHDKFTWIAFGCILLFTIFGITCCIYSQTFDDVELYHAIKIFFRFVEMESNVSNILKGYLLTSISLVFVNEGISLLLLCFVAILLTREFNLYHKNLEAELKPFMIMNNPGTDAIYHHGNRALTTNANYEPGQIGLTELIEKKRQQFERLHGLVRWADELFTVFTALNLLAYVATVCYAVYTLVFFGINLRAYIVAYVTYGLMLCITAALLNHQVSAGSDFLHNLDLSKASCKTIQKINFFYVRMTSNVGLTPLSIFVLDKLSILTLITTMITYTIVMVQFNT